MKTTLKITAVRPILSIAKPIIVLEVLGAEPLVRNPKQMLTDLQNSGRALGINPKAFANGIEGVSQDVRAEFLDEVFNLVGAEVSGDITPFKAGNSYVIRAGHPALTDSTHPSFGKVKEGDSLVAESDGVWIDGFLTIPKTMDERLIGGATKEIAKAFTRMFGGSMNAPTPVAVNPLAETEPESNASATSAEVLGSQKKETAK